MAAGSRTNRTPAAEKAAGSAAAGAARDPTRRPPDNKRDDKKGGNKEVDGDDKNTSTADRWAMAAESLIDLLDLEGETADMPEINNQETAASLAEWLAPSRTTMQALIAASLKLGHGNARRGNKKDKALNILVKSYEHFTKVMDQDEEA